MTWQKTDDGFETKWWNPETFSMIRLQRPRKHGLMQDLWFLDANMLCMGRMITGYYEKKPSDIIKQFLREHN